MPKNTCKASDCDTPARVRGVCDRHYYAYRYGKSDVDFELDDSKRSSEITHGTPGAYSNRGCRCDDCRLAWNLYCNAQKKKKWASWDGYPDPGLKHGSENTYQNHGCRCEDCKKAHSLRVSAGRRIKKESGFLEYKESQKSCEICLRENLPLVVDHDHESGLFRGMLCQRCNTGLGKIGTNEEMLLRAIAYLRKEPPLGNAQFMVH